MDKKKGSIFIMPVFIWLSVLVALPLLYVIVLSFLSRGETGRVVFKFTLDNYARLFEPIYMKIFATSIFIAVIVSLVSLIISYPFAYFVSKLSKKAARLLIVIVIIPFWTSSLLRTSGFIILLQTKGVVNKFLMFLGIIDSPLRLMNNQFSVIMTTVYMLLPFMILPLYNSLDKLDKTLLEASKDLGAGKIATLFRVTIPLTFSGIVGGLVLTFIPCVGLFFISDLMGGAKMMLLGNLIKNQFTTANNQPFGAALSVVLLLIVVMLFGIYSKVSKGEKIF